MRNRESFSTLAGKPRIEANGEGDDWKNEHSPALERCQWTMGCTQVLLVLLCPLWLPCYGLFLLIGCCFPAGLLRWYINNVPGASWQQGDISTEQWQAAHSEAPEVDMPAKGQIISHDFRPSKDTHKRSDDDKAPLRVLSWNIFLGQNLQKVIKELQLVHPEPDIILLQEDNIYTDKRTSTFRHAGGQVARALGLMCAFTPCYYRENPDGKTRGCYGCSILSRHALTNEHAIPSKTRPYLVEKAAVPGWRHYMAADVAITASLLVRAVSVHFPSAGDFKETKIRMFGELLDHLDLLDPQKNTRTVSVIGGDMNTMPYALRYLPPFGPRDLLCNRRTETSMFREYLGSLGWFDPFDNDQGTYKAMGRVHKLDWLMFREGGVTVEAKHVEQMERGDGTHTPSTEPGSDHQWIMADLSST